MSKQDEKDLRNPGTDVLLTITKTSTVTATVVPIGVRHFRKFVRQVTNAVRTLVTAGIPITKDASGDITLTPEALSGLSPIIMEIVSTDLLELVEACVKLPNGIDFQSLPHWCLPPLIQAWVTENFDSEEKVRPWLEMIQVVLTHLTGQTHQITNSASLSSALTAILSPKSTTANSKTTEGQNSRTEDGQSPTSGSESSGPIEPTQ